MILIKKRRAAYQQNLHRPITSVGQRVTRKTRNIDCIAGADFALLVVNLHHALAFKDVVNLFDHLVMMWRDARARRQNLLGQAALIDRRGRAINQRANLGTVRGADDFRVVAVDNEHKVGGVKPRQEPSPGIRGWRATPEETTANARANREFAVVSSGVAPTLQHSTITGPL